MLKNRICLPFLRTAFVFSVVSLYPPQASVIESKEIRNVLFIMGDDHSAEVLACYGNRMIRTPNLDKLASEGTRFDRAFVNAPLCTPSRQSLITGKLPHAAGVTLLQTPLSSEQVTIAEHLKQLGFSTGAIGKMHFNSQLNHGFDYRIDTPDYRKHLDQHPPKKLPEGTRIKPVWKPFQDPARIWLNADGLPLGILDADSEGVYFSERAADFLQKNKANRFCLWLSFHQPHSPFDFPVEYAGRYNPAKMPLPQTGPEDIRWIPAIFRPLTDMDKLGIIASYYDAVEYLDKNIGLVLAELKRLDLEESTLVIYVGDNGYLLGHHGRFEKHTMWEQAVRVPLIIRRGSGQGQVRSTNGLVEFIDLVPTILEVLGVPTMNGIQGKSLLPVMEGKTKTHRDTVFSEYLEDNLVMLRSDEWKYVFTAGKADLALGYATGYPPPGITHRLYNLKQDPGETHNLVTDSRYHLKLEELQNALLYRFKETHPYAKDLPAGASIDEALTWFCDPPEIYVPAAKKK